VFRHESLINDGAICNVKLKFRGRVTLSKKRHDGKEYVYARIVLDAESSRAVINVGLVGAEVAGTLRPLARRERKKEAARAAGP